MDLTTQLVLGASVGYAVLGKEAHKKSLAWGVVGGLIPDLDTATALILDPVDALGLHRGFTHSLLFAFIMAPMMGFIADRQDPKLGLVKWTKLFFWSIVTHPILDSFTGYGTQLFQPFSSYPVAFKSISIVDPIYTVPFYLLIIVLCIGAFRSWKYQLNKIVLIVSSSYLLLTVANKILIDQKFEAAFSKQGIEIDNYTSSPSLLNNILWMGMGQKADTLFVGMYSHFDESDDITFTKVPRQSALVAPFGKNRVSEKLQHFSRGFYRFEERGNNLHFIDLRFGRSDLWTSENGSFTFDYLLDIKNKQLVGFERSAPNISSNYFDILSNRIFGKAPR